MTTLATPPASVGGSPDATPFDGPARMVRVSANLLPDTVIAARRLGKLKRKLGLGLLGLVGLLIVGYGFSWWQTHSARNDLNSAQNANTAMHSQLTAFGPLLNAQSQQESITSNLRLVMATDVQWRDVWNSVKAKVVPGVQLTGFAASTSLVTTSGGGLDVLNHTGLLPIGTISITGTATDSRSVAAFVDGLAVTPGLASPIPSNISGSKGGVAFTINLLLTSDALGGRFTTAAPATTTGGH